MTLLATETVKEILGYANLTHLEADRVQFKGLPVAHNLCFPIDELIAGIHGTIGLLISEIWKLKGEEDQTITIDMFHAFLSLSSVRFMRQNGYALYPWDPKYPTLGIYTTKDGREIFLHGGHATLRDKILRVLETPNESDFIAAAVQKWNAFELEEAIAQADGCAAVVREKDEWLNHPQGKVLNERPPLVLNKLVDSPPEALPVGPRPLSGLKVLDLTRVIAAPTCARVLAEYGADVLHITAPHLTNIPPFDVDTSHGKRQAFVDLRIPDDLTHLKKMISEADVFVEGWRPNTMAKYGLSPEDVQKIRPGIIHITFSCYGNKGPWKDRAGWEQLGQAVSGIIDSNFDHMKKHSDTIATHHIFPNDYISGYLGAAGVLAALIKRHTEGGGVHISMALSRHGMWAISKTATNHEETRQHTVPIPYAEYKPYLSYSRKGPFGTLEYLSPAVELSVTPPQLLLPAAPLGSGKLEWANGDETPSDEKDYILKTETAGCT